ncbi:hypothetical protein ACFYXM_35000 [Streptomyces sp. NPDC002476]|uniref:hypothetical protein n=1 Tax=Streptomyces sp. NPDC002476 TaxID=3364648 RepID=UPI0036CB5820
MSSHSLAVTGLELAHGAAVDPLLAEHIPLIAMTAGEMLPEPDVVRGGDGWLAYRVPGPYDRYPGVDVLVARTSGAPGGRVDGSRLSPWRQIHCMANLLCQGCGAPAARLHGAGVLWVRSEFQKSGQRTSATGLTDMPPSCARCALRWCPVLAKQGRQLVFAGEAEEVGVFATVYPPPRGTAVPEQLVRWEDEPRITASLATRLVRDLQKVTRTNREAVARLVERTARQRSH